MGWKKVLLADDIDLFLELEKTFFQRSGVELLVARNGQQAFSMAVIERPDLVILNLGMPEIDGAECCRRIKEHPEVHSTPVLLLVPGDAPGAIDRARAAGGDDVLTKPINRTLFLEVAGKHLGFGQRNDPRVKARLRIHYGTGRQQLLSDYSVNLSTGGVFIETTEVLPIDTPLSLEFALPKVSQIIRCKGRVAWLNPPDKILSPQLPPGMGVQFVDLRLEELHDLKEFLKNEILHPSW